MTDGIKLPFKVGISPTLNIRGLIATEMIEKGRVIEKCPVVTYPKNPTIIEQTIFDHYVFDWGDTHEALALGYGSLYNHNKYPNVGFTLAFKDRYVVFTAIRDIKNGEELFINYDSSAEEPESGYLQFDKDLDR